MESGNHPPAVFLKSQKGKDILNANGFLFAREKSGAAGKTIWRCIEYAPSKCRGRAHTLDGTIVFASDTSSHNHLPHPANTKAKQVVANLKEQAKSSTETPQALIASASQGLPASVVGQLPTVPRMKRTIQRARQGVAAPPPTPTSLEVLEIPHRYTVTATGEPFLLFDSQPGPQRILIFTTRANLELMANCDHWYADGTFKTAPPLFKQVYAIHAVRHSNVIPTVYALLPGKTRQIYSRVLAELKVLEPNLNPVSIMTDFEKAQMTAFDEQFPDIESRGCFFHFSQCLWRKIQEFKEIRDKYLDPVDTEFSLKLRQLQALAFVPLEDVELVFEELENMQFFVSNKDLLQPFMNYFEDAWIGRWSRNNTRNAPTAAPRSMWNCYLATVQDQPRTNNSVEGWHRAFSSLLSSNHPSIWKFIEGLQLEQSLNELKVTQYLAGNPPPTSRRKYVKYSERIKNIVLDYGNRGLEEYLLGISQNLTLQSS